MQGPCHLDKPGGVITINGVAFQFQHKDNHLSISSNSKMTDVYNIFPNPNQVIPFKWIDSQASVQISIQFDHQVSPSYVFTEQLNQRKMIEEGIEGLTHKIKYRSNQVKCLINKYLCCCCRSHPITIATSVSIMVTNDLSTGQYTIGNSKLTIISRMN